MIDEREADALKNSTTSDVVTLSLCRSTFGTMIEVSTASPVIFKRTYAKAKQRQVFAMRSDWFNIVETSISQPIQHSRGLCC